MRGFGSEGSVVVAEQNVKLGTFDPDLLVSIGDTVNLRTDGRTVPFEGTVKEKSLALAESPTAGLVLVREGLIAAIARSRRGMPAEPRQLTKILELVRDSFVAQIAAMEAEQQLARLRSWDGPAPSPHEWDGLRKEVRRVPPLGEVEEAVVASDPALDRHVARFRSALAAGTECAQAIVQAVAAGRRDTSELSVLLGQLDIALNELQCESRDVGAACHRKASDLAERLNEVAGCVEQLLDEARAASPAPSPELKPVPALMEEKDAAGVGREELSK